jgi:branched-chain amino acid transport system permease protein
MSNKTIKFKPLNIGRLFVWSSFALILVLAPLLFTSSLSHTMLSQMGIFIIICLSYNILLGQGGMLSFGHAVYSGLGAFMAIHTINMISSGVTFASEFGADCWGIGGFGVRSYFWFGNC